MKYISKWFKPTQLTITFFLLFIIIIGLSLMHNELTSRNFSDIPQMSIQKDYIGDYADLYSAYLMMPLYGLLYKSYEYISTLNHLFEQILDKLSRSEVVGIVIVIVALAYLYCIALVLSKFIHVMVSLLRKPFTPTPTI
jgi:hypothetical protein